MSATPTQSPAPDHRLREMEKRQDDVAYRIAFLRLTEWQLREELEFYRREIERLKLEKP